MIVSAKTDLGRVRQTNQDYFIVKNEKVGVFPNLFLLADGVGSNRLSGFASKSCCDFIIDEAMRSNDTDNYVNSMAKLYKLVNIDLYNRILINPEYRGMGTTMVMATIDNNKLLVGNIGDSRLYHIRGEIVQVTRDHSLAEDFVQQKQISKYSKEYYDYKNQLTKAVGAGRIIQPDFFEVEIMAGDYILMCSDGLSNMVSDEDIKKIVLNDDTLDSRVDKLVDTANANGGKDNIAVILIYIDNIDKTKILLDNDKMQNNDNYVPHVEVGEEDDTKVYNKINDLTNLKVNVDDILSKDKITIDEDLQGRSRKRSIQTEDDLKNEEQDVTKYERKEGNDYDYEE